ncbi:unnamed protein product [Cuscuta campestris]|uniref:Uncharacterized protein n=1 Tax=Cuscuta campestris TaxID=132261 RepID=A0A484LMA4_9ASTE|nr:unnamed protein product [Cuscuta campestris]
MVRCVRPGKFSSAVNKEIESSNGWGQNSTPGCSRSHTGLVLTGPKSKDPNVTNQLLGQLEEPDADIPVRKFLDNELLWILRSPSSGVNSPVRALLLQDSL